MTGRIEKTVFISYRRTNLPWALAVYQELTHQGYDVFFDYLSIPSGDFENIIVENIKGRAHFVVILTPSALERCNEPGDWLRREIETAMDEKRNIVPLMLESFDFGSPLTIKALTGKLEKLKKYNGLRLHSDYFFEGMNRLREQYLKVPLEAIVHPISANATSSIEENQSAAGEVAKVVKEQLTAQEWFERGYVFATESNNLDEAIRCLSEAAYLNPTDAYVYGIRGTVYVLKENYEEGIKDFNEAIKLKSTEETFYVGRSMAYRGKNKIENAIEDITEAIRLMPDRVDSYHDRGSIYQLTSDFKSAYQDYAKAVKLMPDNGVYSSSLMIVLRKLGRFDEAKEQEKLARDLIVKELEYNQACFEAVCGNTERALELLRIGLDKNQSSKAWARQDPDLENLYDDPRFKELVSS